MKKRRINFVWTCAASAFLFFREHGIHDHDVNLLPMPTLSQSANSTVSAEALAKEDALLPPPPDFLQRLALTSIVPQETPGSQDPAVSSAMNRTQLILYHLPHRGSIKLTLTPTYSASL